MAFGVASVVTNAGKAIVTNRIIGSGTEPKYIGIGTGATGAARTALAADTALTTEIETRATGTGSRVTTSVTNDTYQTTGTINITGTRAIDEIGTFDASTVGNMFTSATVNPINLVNGDSITVTVKTSFA